MASAAKLVTPEALDRGSGSGFDRIVSMGALVLAGAQIPLVLGMNSLTLVSLALLPVTLPRVLESRLGRLVILLVVLATCNGILLAYTGDHEVSTSNAAFMVILLLSCFGLYTIVVWAVPIIGVGRCTVLFCIGMLMPMIAGAVVIEENAWKYGYSLPIAAIAFVLLGRGNTGARFWGILGVGVLGAFLDSRSFFGICLATAVVVLLSARRVKAAGPMTNGRSRVWAGAALSAIIALIYVSASTMFSRGFFGDGAKSVTEGQLLDGRTLIFTARPEWFATFSLAEENPWGYGIGAVPTFGDYLKAAEGLASINIDAGGSYYTDYLFGGHFKLHSVLADLWVNFGVFGFGVGIVLIGILSSALLSEMTSSRASVLCVFATLSALWFMFFGPIMSNLPWVMFALGIAHVQLIRSRAADSDGVEPPGARVPGTLSGPSFTAVAKQNSGLGAQRR